MKEKMAREYLGDGVYAIYDSHGGIQLLANDLAYPTDRIYLEELVLKNLQLFKQQCDRKFFQPEGGKNE